jgi:hypothetical protein
MSVVKKHNLALALPLLACSSESQGDGGEASGITITTLTASATDGDTGTGGSAEGPVTGVDDATAEDDGPVGPKFDVAPGTYCEMRAPGIYCSDNVAIECGANGTLVGEDDCDPDICLEGTGCVECLAGQYTCMAEKVMVCNAAVVPPVWEVFEVCDPASGEVCDLGMASCQPGAPVGTNVPTGEYYQFADFQTGATAFLGGYDVDSWEDRLYVLNFSNTIDVYQVELLDSDADGLLEPNQHPDNPEEPGAIEQRLITYIETLPSFGTPSLSSSELLALEDRIFIGGSALTESVFGGAVTPITSPPPWANWFAHIAHDDVNDVWYASNESQRRVFQHDKNTNTWGLAFYYPELAGDHMDGMEVVTDPNTGIPYVYVSDMTSDFIGQYRLDPVQGWVQENLFTYVGTAGAPVEGMGFGALYHFWATAGNSVYEIGGGDLSDYVDPPG